MKIESRKFLNEKLAADVDHGPRRRFEPGFADTVPGFLLLNCLLNEVSEIDVAGAIAHQSMQIMLPH